MRSKIGKQAAGVREGTVSFGEFEVATRKEWRALAQTIMRRWRVPAWVDVDDVVQDLELGAWLAICAFDGTRGVSMQRYVLYNAFDKAKKRVHKYRASYRHRGADGACSRIEVPSSDLMGDASMDTPAEQARRNKILSSAHVEPGQEAVTEIGMSVRRVAAEMHYRPRIAIESFMRTLDISSAASRIYDDPRTRLMCRFGNEQQAMSFVSRVVQQVGIRLAQEKAA